MKNKVVESLYRAQLGIDDDVDVKVEFIAVDADGYSFEVTWFNVDVRYTSKITLPRIEYGTQDMLD